MEIIAKIQTDFPTKFGIPRQSGLVESLKGVITFEPKYRNPQGVYGLDGYSYIWLLWSFSENHREGWSATVKPPSFCNEISVSSKRYWSFLCKIRASCPR